LLSDDTLLINKSFIKSYQKTLQDYNNNIKYYV